MTAVASGSDSDDFDDDFDSLFTVSKEHVAEKLEKEKIPEDEILETCVETIECSDDEVLPNLTPSAEKKTRLAAPIPTKELPTIVIPDDVQPVRGRGRGRGRGKKQPTKAQRRRSRGARGITEIDALSPEFVSSTSTMHNWSLDDSVKDDSIDLEEENYEISVKVCWQSKTVTPFSIRKFQKISKIFEFYAKQEGIQPSQLQLTLGDRIVSPNDSPDSLGITVANILEGGIITSAAASSTVAAPNRSASPIEENSIQLKIRTKESKQPVLIRIQKNQKMAIMMSKYAELCDILPNNALKFSFDGDIIQPNETPADLDLEGGELIEVTS